MNGFNQGQLLPINCFALSSVAHMTRQAVMDFESVMWGLSDLFPGIKAAVLNGYRPFCKKAQVYVPEYIHQNVTNKYI